MGDLVQCLTSTGSSVSTLKNVTYESKRRDRLNSTLVGFHSGSCFQKPIASDFVYLFSNRILDPLIPTLSLSHMGSCGGPPSCKIACKIYPNDYLMNLINLSLQDRLGSYKLTIKVTCHTAIVSLQKT